MMAAAALLGTIGLYFLLAGEVSFGEALAGAPIVAMAVLYARTLAGAATLPLRLPPRAWWSAVRAMGAFGPDLWRVGVALGRAVLGQTVAGRLAEQPFRFGGVDPAEAGRRAVVVTALSLAPNGFVVRVAEGEALQVHQLAEAAASGDAEWPI